MTFPAIVRVFFAVDLPAPMKESLDKFISMLKKKSKSKGIRWTKLENLHITLQFLAEVHTEHLPHLIDEVRQQLGDKKTSLHLTLGALRLFPNPYRPRVIVMDVNPQEELAHLSALIGQGIQSAQYPIEDRPFRAHLTLGRIKHTGLNLDFLSEVSLPVIEALPIREVVLFRSEPQADGSRYTALDVVSVG